MADSATSEQLTKAAQLLEKAAKPILDAVTKVLPYIIEYTELAWNYYQKLPHDTLECIIGSIFCFFGGVFPLLFAAIEAAKHGGIDTLTEALGDLAEEGIKILEASKKDDDVDADNDGVKDVNQIEGKALIIRKANLVLTKMNPNKVDKALSSIYKVWLSVIAVLTVEFARTISLAMSISNFLKKPIDRYVSPTLQSVTPDEYDKWVPVLLGWLAKAIAMSIAWYIQAIISAFTSAMTGSIMISRALLRILNKKGMTLGGLVPANDKETSFDEVAAYVFAAIGFYFQFKMNFSLPFPLNILLFPFNYAEYYLRWVVTKV